MTARRLATVTVATAICVGLAGPAAAAQPTSGSDAPVGVIVRELPGSGDRPERAVQAFGGTVSRQLSIIGAFTASVPRDRLAALRAAPGVDSVTEDGSLELADAEVEQQSAQPGSLYTIANEVTGASAMWDAGYTGRGVDVWNPNAIRASVMSAASGRGRYHAGCAPLPTAGGASTGRC